MKPLPSLPSSLSLSLSKERREIGKRVEGQG